MDVLLDVNVVVDICAQRPAFAATAQDGVRRCKEHGGRVWLYTGSVQTCQYVLRDALAEQLERQGKKASGAKLLAVATALLKNFAEDKHWLATLAGEGDVFNADDPEDEQLLRSLDRFAPGAIALLTRDKVMLKKAPERTITPEQYCRQSTVDRTLDFIDLKTQQDAVRPQLEKNIHRVLHHGRYIMGPEVRELEETLARYVGVTHCVAVSSGTDALFIAMMALGVGPGDEVITTPFTFIATGEMIALCGAKPVFVDIDPQTYNIDPTLIEAAITSQTKAVMPVSLYGQCADFDALNAIANTHGLPVIEDGAQSFGATYKGRKSCGLSTIGATSFFPSKPLGGYGDGGALFTNDDAVAKAMREIRVHGQDRRYHHPRIGVNGRLDTMQAAILLAKMERFPEEVERRRHVGQRYTDLINDRLAESSSPLIITPHIAEGATSVYAQYTIQVDNRDELCRSLSEAGIPTAIHYPVPLHLQTAFSVFGYRPGDFPVAEQVAKRVISLPMGPDLGEADQARIASAVMDAVRVHGTV